MENKIKQFCTCGAEATPEHMATHQRAFEGRPEIRWEGLHKPQKEEADDESV